MRHLFVGHVVCHGRGAAHQQAAESVGVNHLYSALPAYVFIMGGGGHREPDLLLRPPGHSSEISLRADLAEPGATLAKNASLAATGGIMWYLQFFFYAWGEANIPSA